MRVSVAFGAEHLELDVPDDAVLGVWDGPAALPHAAVTGMVHAALEGPIDFPPLRQAVIPGDHVVIATEPDLPHAAGVVEAVYKVLRSAGVQDGTIQIVVSAQPTPEWLRGVPTGPELILHDPTDRTGLAYLASTKQGRRVYLNRHLTDADCVIPIGLLGFDPLVGYRGPWSVIFPGLSDDETLRSFRAHATDSPADRNHPRGALVESADVSWLLGSQFQLGVLEGAGGILRVIAGLEGPVRTEGMVAVDDSWSYHPPERADLVVVGVGQPGERPGWNQLGSALATGQHLVRRGGKIVVLSRVEGTLGPALSLIDPESPRQGSQALKAAEGEPDYPAARQVAQALAWADVYLLSALDPDTVDQLGMIALEQPNEARRLASASPSCHFVSHADLTRAMAREDE